MVVGARAFAHAKLLKLKLTGEPVDAGRMRAARLDASLAVDASQGFARPFLEELLPVLAQARVTLIEQLFKRGQEAQLDGQIAIRIAAGERAQTLSDLPRLVGRFEVINIKLDKCGGLAEALVMAPAFLVGQLLDLDGRCSCARIARRESNTRMESCGIQRRCGVLRKGTNCHDQTHRSARP
jgi:hypothetical protein